MLTLNEDARYHFTLRWEQADLAGRIPTFIGCVHDVTGILVKAHLRQAAVGDQYVIEARSGPILCEVLALSGEVTTLMPYGELDGIAVGDAVQPVGPAAMPRFGNNVLGRVVDPLLRPLDGLPLSPGDKPLLLHKPPLPLTERLASFVPLSTQIRALDAFVPLGVGQRLGIFAGPGVGKSTLLGMLVRNLQVDVVVIALVGERGREVNDFLTRSLNEKTRKQSVVVVATSDRPAPERIRAPFVALSIAEHFRDQGLRVGLFLDSLTRFCMAQREVGLSVGEPPTSKGYTPSVFAQLPRILERVAARTNGGSITGLFTILTEGDEAADPIADAARGLLDGHLILRRTLADRGHFPAIDVLRSLSRWEGELLAPATLSQVRTTRGWLAKLEDAEDLINIGAYQAGADPLLDEALRKRPGIAAFLQQGRDEVESQANTHALLAQLTGAGSKGG